MKEDKNQPRIFFNQEAIDGIAETYKEHGVIQPIEIDDNNIIVTGAMRYRAAKKAGLETIPVKVLEGIDSKDRYVRQAVENMNRSDFTPTENEAVVKKLKKLYPNLSVRELADKIGKTSSFIQMYTVLVSTPDYIRRSVKEKKMDVSTAYEISRVPKEYKKNLTDTVVRNKMGAHEARVLKRRLQNASPEEAKRIFKQNYKGKNASEVEMTAMSVAPTVLEKPNVAYKQLEEMSQAFLRFLEANHKIIFEDSIYEKRVVKLLLSIREEIDSYLNDTPKKVN